MDYSLNYNEDNVEKKGFLDKNEILQYVSEEEIYSLVFGFKPEEYQYVCSPLRTDSSPGAYFERSPQSNRLLFIDWGDGERAIEDCFGCVKRYFGLSNFYQTMLFINKHLVEGKSLTKRGISTPKERVHIKKERTEILFSARGFMEPDKIFWSRYKITKKNLMEDKVFPVSKYVIKSPKTGNHLQVAYTPCYAFTEFASSNRKLYFPYKEGSKRFLTNCSKNDVGGINSLFEVPQLVITKSYKDFRVLKNQGLNVVWFQNEGMFPDNEILLPLVEKYQEVIVFYDNDETGIRASKHISDYINSYYPNKSRPLHLPVEYLEKGVTDPSDMIFKMGEDKLKNFIKENINDR